jgi:5'-nucleotidase/UDP-sugar diphosphatase
MRKKHNETMTLWLYFLGIVSMAALSAYGFDIRAQDSGTIHVTLLYTNNTNGYVNACDCEENIMGGLAKRKTVFDRVRKENKNMLALDAGDMLNQFGSDPPQDEKVIELYEKLRYDAVTIGDNELANGMDFFKAHVLASQLPMISATLTKQDSGNVASSYVLRTLGGIRFGIVGYTPQSSFRHFPKDKRLEVKADHEKEKLRSVLKEISGKADRIILLSHAGYDEDIPLALEFPAIDLIVGGHSQTELQEPKAVGKTLILQAGFNGNVVGRLDLVFSGKEILSSKNKLIPLDVNVPEDTVFKTNIGRWMKQKK